MLARFNQFINPKVNRINQFGTIEWAKKILMKFRIWTLMLKFYQINAGQLLGKFKSQKVLYKILTEHRRWWKSHEYILVQYYLPTMKGTPLRFLRQLLKGEKKIRKAQFVIL